MCSIFEWCYRYEIANCASYIQVSFHALPIHISWQGQQGETSISTSIIVLLVIREISLCENDSTYVFYNISCKFLLILLFSFIKN